MNQHSADIAIVGAGGLGKETAVLIDQINAHTKTWNIVGFFDDGIEKGSNVLSIPVLGGILELNQFSKPLNIIIAIGNPVVKAQLAERIINSFLIFPILIHPTALIGRQVTIGEGTIITAGCVLTVDIQVGKHVLLNLNTTVGHDVILDDYTSVMPGAHLSGSVKVGKAVFIGTGVSVLQHIQLGDKAIIGAGAVVTKSIPQAQTVVGVPARFMKK